MAQRRMSARLPGTLVGLRTSFSVLTRPLHREGGLVPAHGVVLGS